MKKLNHIFLFKIVFIILILLRIFVFNKISSKYNNNDSIINGIINKIEIDGNKLSLEVLGKEKIIANYYFKETEQNKIYSYKLGDKVNLKCKLNVPKENTNYNLFNYKNYLLSKKINYICKIENISLIHKNENILYELKNNLVNHVNKYNSSIYLKAFILGENNINEDIVSSYQSNGISHLFAISGMHITLISTILLFILNKIFKKKKRNIFIIIIFLIFYSFLTNFSPSVLRATLLFSIINIKNIFNFNIKTIEILILILGILLLYNPYYIYNIGFIFSFTNSIFLILFGNISNNYKNYFVKLFITSLISFLSSIPILINNFFSINLLTPIINIIFVPLITFIVFPFSLITLFIPILDNILLFITNIMENLSILISKISINIILPKVSIYIIFIYYVIIVFILYKMKYGKFKYLLILIFVMLFHTNIRYLNKYPIITLIDVGQGDAILIELPYNKSNILIDTGGITTYEDTWYIKKNTYSISSKVLIPYLKSIGIKSLDYLILTHGDYDHVGEANNLINNFKINNVFFNSGNNNYNENIIINNLKKKNINFLNINEYSINIDNYIFNFINKKNTSNENGDSLIIYSKLNNKNILLMGDSGKKEEKQILNTYNIKNVDILKVGHHGSKYSTDENFIKTINPKYAFISVGINNKFNHPNEETLNTLKKYNVSSYLTSKNGMIKITIKNKIEIKTCQK